MKILREIETENKEKTETIDVTKELIQAIYGNPDLEKNDLAWETLKEIVTTIDPPLDFIPLVFAANRNLTFEVALIMSIFTRLLDTVKNNPNLSITTQRQEINEESKVDAETQNNSNRS